MRGGVVPPRRDKAVTLKRRKRGVRATTGETPKGVSHLDPGHLVAAGREEFEDAALVPSELQLIMYSAIGTFQWKHIRSSACEAEVGRC